MVMSALDTFMRKVAWGDLDVLVIDMPPGTGDAQLSITQRLRLSGAVIVSTPQVGSIPCFVNHASSWAHNSITILGRFCTVQVPTLTTSTPSVVPLVLHPCVAGRYAPLLPDTTKPALLVGRLMLPIDLSASRVCWRTQVRASHASPCCHAQDIALIDARRGATMFRTVSVPTLGIVENMSFYICPSCAHEAHIFGHGGAARTGQELNMELLGQVCLVCARRIGVPKVARCLSLASCCRIHVQPDAGTCFDTLSTLMHLHALPAWQLLPRWHLLPWEIARQPRLL